jgi:carnitine O-acetyltransferase
MIFRQKLKQGLIKPDGTKEGPHCMDSYRCVHVLRRVCTLLHVDSTKIRRWMFDCCRIPGPQGLDWSISYAKEGDLGDSGHIIVFRKNRVWKVNATKDGKILSFEDFERQFQHIYDSTTQEYPGVGVLPSNNRDIWAKDYAELVSDAHNTVILQAIHSAAFSISLDTAIPSNPVAHSRDLWHGGVANSTPNGLRNRWVDKPVQFIVFDNAEAGIMGEHSVMDGTPTARMCDEILDLLHDPAFDKGQPSSSALAAPTPLDWTISSTTIQAMKAADKAAMDLISSQELTFLKTTYGKAAIKNFGVSPDSWAQMIIQLAYRRLVGDSRNGGTYEAATTRKFFKGRTEAIKVVTSESDAWAMSMDDPGKDQFERKRLFDEAAKKHIQLAKNSGNGQGVDRHMLGLKLLVEQDEEMPAVFSDPLVARASKWVLSTSAIFSKHFPVYGWGEVRHYTTSQ